MTLYEIQFKIWFFFFFLNYIDAQNLQLTEESNTQIKTSFKLKNTVCVIYTNYNVQAF